MAPGVRGVRWGNVAERGFTVVANLREDDAQSIIERQANMNPLKTKDAVARLGSFVAAGSVRSSYMIQESAG